MYQYTSLTLEGKSVENTVDRLGLSDEVPLGPVDGASDFKFVVTIGDNVVGYLIVELGLMDCDGCKLVDGSKVGPAIPSASDNGSY
jgi:hypothetical protein